MKRAKKKNRIYTGRAIKMEFAGEKRKKKEK